ncbi:hypothetical protein Nmel_016855, partial [Mimus melanotis]
MGAAPVLKACTSEVVEQSPFVLSSSADTGATKVGTLHGTGSQAWAPVDAEASGFGQQSPAVFQR